MLAGLFGRRELLRTEAGPLIEAYAELAVSRGDYLRACETWIACDRELLTTAQLEGRVAPWLASLPTSVLYFLHTANGGTHRTEFRRRVRVALRDYPAEDIAPATMAPKISAARPRPMTLTDAIRGSAAWKEYEEITETGAATLETFLSTLQPFEQDILREVVDRGAVFDCLLTELLSAFDMYSDMISFITSQITAEDTLAVLFHHRKSGALVADPWLHNLSLSQILALFNATKGGFATTCRTLLDRVPNPLPPESQTRKTSRRRASDTPVPQKMPEHPFTVDAGYINKTLTQHNIPANIRKLVSAIIDELPEKHHEWTISRKAAALINREGFYRVRLGLRYRLIYALNTDTRTIHIYFVGSHEDYNHVTSTRRTAALQEWAAQRRHTLILTHTKPSRRQSAMSSAFTSCRNQKKVTNSAC